MRPYGIQTVKMLSHEHRSTAAWLRLGYRVRVDGPYGVFTHLAAEERGALLFIAGGIGVTPMLSMLAYLADSRGQWQRVKLIWSMGSEARSFLENDLEVLQERLPNRTFHRVFTRSGYGARRLGKDMLQTLLGDVSRCR